MCYICITEGHGLANNYNHPPSRNNMMIDTQTIFLIIALVSSGVFLVQFVISIFFGDVDVDVDGSGDTDTDMGSVFSFKGLIHFLIGFGWTKVLFVGHSWQSYLGAVAVGLVFVFALLYIYVLAFRLQKLRKPEGPSQLIGRAGRIYINLGDGRYTLFIERDGSTRQLDVVSESGKTDYLTNETVTVGRFSNNTYYIA